MFDAKIASPLKKLLTSVHFRKRVSVEEQPAQDDDRFLRGRQIACKVDEHVPATGAHEKQYKVNQICSIYDYKVTTSKYDGTKLHWLQVKYLQKWS